MRQERKTLEPPVETATNPLPRFSIWCWAAAGEKEERIRSRAAGRRLKERPMDLYLAMTRVVVLRSRPTVTAR